MNLCPGSYDKNPEVLGYILNGPGRGTLYTSYVFLSVAMQELAFLDAGCTSTVCPVMNGTQPYREEYYLEDDDKYSFDDEFLNDYYECKNKTNGFRPSSLMALMMTVASIMSVLGLPIVGAAVDFTPHRKLIGQVLISIAVVGNAVQVGISQDTWIYMAALQAALKLVIDGHQLCMFSYVGELSQDLEKDLPEIQGYAKIWNDFICLFYIIIVGTVEIKKDHAHPDGCTDVVTIAIAGQIVACIIGGVLLFFMEKYATAPCHARPAPRQEHMDHRLFPARHYHLRDQERLPRRVHLPLRPCLLELGHGGSVHGRNPIPDHPTTNGGYVHLLSARSSLFFHDRGGPLPYPR